MGGSEAETPHQQSVKRRAHKQVANTEECANVKRKRHGWESQITPASPFWRGNPDGSIPCPPKKCGGCGKGKLELRRKYKDNWVTTLLKDAEDFTTDFKMPDADISQGCSSLPVPPKLFGGN
ncbi:hypothetical protein C1H46_024366 [Malus baccata]|uniref:Uncharacterized protein n=1 Tax=Malus baccata TaxID=106549 RepID=A0A540LU60_MALBA|nr:hypothetical protein C1H46_024366 [Malus baccata]